MFASNFNLRRYTWEKSFVISGGKTSLKSKLKYVIGGPESSGEAIEARVLLRVSTRMTLNFLLRRLRHLWHRPYEHSP